MRTILLSLLLATSLSAHAAGTYYVSVRGSDANPGTERRPFRTIARAVQLVDGPDDRIYVKAGTYNERVFLYDKHGSAAAPIRIEGWGSDVPIIDGTGVTGNGLVEINRSSYVNFDRFEVRNSANAGIFVYNANHIKVRYNRVHGSRTSGINAWTAQASPRGTTHAILIEGNRVWNNVRQNATGKAATWQQGLSAYGATDVQIVGNSVYENYGEGIDYIMSSNGVISGNRIRDNFSINLYLDNATDTVVERNFIHTHGRKQFFRNGDPASGITMANEFYEQESKRVQNPLRNLRIVNNIILRASNGIAYGDWDYGHGLHDTLIANNTVYAPKYYNLYLGNRSNVHDTTRVENNIFVQNLPTKSYANAPAGGVTYAHNNWYGGNANTRMNGRGDVNANPRFAESNGRIESDFQLTAGSPCINTGATQTGYSNDFFSATPVRTRTWDIGADEF